MNRERINWKEIIKEGNIVKVRQWDDMAEEFGFKTEYVSAEVAQAIVEEEDAPEDLPPLLRAREQNPPEVALRDHADLRKLVA